MESSSLNALLRSITCPGSLLIIVGEGNLKSTSSYVSGAIMYILLPNKYFFSSSGFLLTANRY
jgi:hypothetical protein